MPTLRFNIEQVRKHYEHAKASDQHKPTFGEQIDAFGDDAIGMEYGEIERKMNAKGALKPALWLVKDEGIYIMSNGTAENRPDVVFAKGFNPKTRDRMEVWGDARDAVGGDDFVELIDHDTCEALLANKQAKTLGIKVTANRIEFLLYHYENNFSRVRMNT